MWETIQNWIALIWPLLLGFLLYAVVAPLTTIHIVLTKREVRAAIGWTGLVWLAPLLGAGLYFCFGVNRIQRRATSLGLQQSWNERRPHDFGQSDDRTRQHIAEHYPDLLGLSQLVERLTDCPISEGP